MRLHALAFGCRGMVSVTMTSLSSDCSILSMAGPGLAAGDVFTAVAFGIKIVLPPMNPLILGGLTLGPYGLVYLGLTLAFGVPQAKGLLQRAGLRRV